MKLFLVTLRGTVVAGRWWLRVATPGCVWLTLLLIGPSLSAQVPPPNGPGYGLYLDGVNDYASVAHNPGLNVYPLTLSLWVKTSRNALLVDGVMSKYVGGGYNGYSLLLYNGRIRGFYFRDPANYVWDDDLGLDGGFIADGAWHHVALVVDAAGGRLLVDGVVRSALFWTGTPGAPTTALPLLMGYYAGASSGFLGQMDEMRVWNAAHSTAQIQADMRRQLYGNESGLVGYWRFDEGSGPSAFDATGNAAQTAALNNGPLWVSSLITPFAPSVVTQPSSSGPLGSATLNGIVFFNGAATAAYFQWGATTNYGNVTPPQNFGSLGSNTFSQLVTGLTSGVVYHYRAVATNIHGPSFGADQTIPNQGSYILAAAVIAGGGSETSGGGYNLSATIGQWDADPMAAVTDEVLGGFWNTEVLPWLRIQRTGASVLVAWLASFTGFQLQQSPAIAGPQASWGNVNQPVTVVNGENQVTFNNLSGNRFFRLRKP